MIIFLFSILALSTLSYGFFALFISWGLLKRRNVTKSNDLADVAVIIAARNEEDNLEDLLSDLVNQQYDGKLDIYVADDRSTDATGRIIDRFSRQYAHIHGVKILETSSQMTPKKHALTECLKRSTAEIILSTDADCRVGPSWVATAVSHLGTGVGILVGYSEVESSTPFSQYQALDFAAIMVTNAGMMAQGYAWSGSGQNLAYRRSAFTEIGGFVPVASKISGDDVYLVQNIPRLTGLEAKFVFEAGHFAKTQPVATIRAFLNQRIRWSSNSRGLEKNDPLFFGFLLSAFLTNFLILVSLLMGQFGMGLWLPLSVKFLYEGLVLLLGAKIFGYWNLLKWYPLWFTIQPIYITYVGLMGLRGKFLWKP